MTIKILLMGLPGAGKSTLAKAMISQFKNQSVIWYNADQVRKIYNDWDFTTEGRLRQARRMKELAESNHGMDYVIADFICPLESMRDIFDADWTIWVDTIDKSRFQDTDKIFVEPKKYDFRITEQNAEYWAKYIVEKIQVNQRRPTFDWKKPTVQQLGRWQPWHPGHRALFERLLARTGQVCIMVRDCQGWNNSNPFDFEQIKSLITRDLEPLYQGMFEVIRVPNITHIGYGRDVGYTIEQEHFSQEIESISATKIRKENKL